MTAKQFRASMRPGQLTPENQLLTSDQRPMLDSRDAASMRPGQLTPENRRMASIGHPPKSRIVLQ